MRVFLHLPKVVQRVKAIDECDDITIDFVAFAIRVRKSMMVLVLVLVLVLVRP